MIRFLLSLLTVALLITFCQQATEAQNTYEKYWIAFTDKANSPYTVENPSLFLSERALARRERYAIDIVENDLPVNPSYVTQLKDLGANILYTSKWLNGVVAQISDTSVLLQIKNLPFVKNDLPVHNELVSSVWEEEEMQYIKGKQNLREPYYGNAFNQTQMLNGDWLHAYGYTGQGMLIGVMDAGFKGADTLTAFQHLRDNGQIVGKYDFVDLDTSIYESSSHGTRVLSIMAASWPNIFVGTAPQADYLLFRTEDIHSETRIEEFNWIAAAEQADSMGVDVLNTSLGYSTFDDTLMNYTYADLDGATSFITVASDIAASKGILVVGSAGNQGRNDWKYITPPADAKNILTVGAVDSLETYVDFSSIGPTVDGRIKPNLVAQGRLTVFVDTNDTLRAANGTSFSTPIIAGLAACLWQANLEQTNTDIIKALEESANQAENPDNFLGYGIPDFYAALLGIKDDPFLTLQPEADILVYPNPFSTDANVYYFSPRAETVVIELFNVNGQLVETLSSLVAQYTHYKFNFDSWPQQASGVYFVKISSANANFKQMVKAIKL